VDPRDPKPSAPIPLGQYTDTTAGEGGGSLKLLCLVNAIDAFSDPVGWGGVWGGVGVDLCRVVLGGVVGGGGFFGGGWCRGGVGGGFWGGGVSGSLCFPQAAVNPTPRAQSPRNFPSPGFPLTNLPPSMPLKASLPVVGKALPTLLCCP